MFALTVDDDIQIRLYEEWHAQSLFDLADNNREHLGQYLGWVQHTHSVNDSLNFIKSTRKSFVNGQGIHANIVYKGQFAGGIGLHIRNRMAGIGEIGYWLGSSFTGKGIMTRAVSTLLDYTFGSLKLNRVVIRCDLRNTASCAIPTRLGFTHEGIHRESVYANNEFGDMNIFALVADEWRVKQVSVFEHRVDAEISIRMYENEHIEPALALVNTNRDHLRAWLNWVDSTRTPADMQGFIIGGLDQYVRNDGFQAGIWYQGELVGSIGFHRWDFAFHVTEIGYWLDKAHTGKGIMTRAVKAMVKIAFEQVNLNRVMITCAVDNERSCAIPERLGFTHESVARAQEFVNGQHHDAHIYALLKREWQG